MKRLRDELTLASKLRYLLWRGSRTKERFLGQVRGGPAIVIRPPPATDLLTAYEVFVMRLYDRVASKRLNLIVDLGANVGYTCLLWLNRAPGARVIAFEPHPVHLDVLRSNLAANRVAHKVELFEAAAGATRRRSQLTNAENESTLVSGDKPGSIEVAVLDCIEIMLPLKIDLLKMDIEGSEFEILNDPRFEKLSLESLAVEWHWTADHTAPKSECRDRLEQLGFSITHEFEYSDRIGMLYATRRH